MVPVMELRIFLLALLLLMLQACGAATRLGRLDEVPPDEIQNINAEYESKITHRKISMVAFTGSREEPKKYSSFWDDLVWLAAFENNEGGFASFPIDSVDSWLASILSVNALDSSGYSVRVERLFLKTSDLKNENYRACEIVAEVDVQGCRSLGSGMIKLPGSYTRRIDYENGPLLYVIEPSALNELVALTLKRAIIDGIDKQLKLKCCQCKMK